MAKTRARKNFLRKSFKNIKATSSKVLPVVQKGLANVGSFVTNATMKSVPFVKKGLMRTFNAVKNTSRYAITGVKKTLSRKRSHKRRRH